MFSLDLCGCFFSSRVWLRAPLYGNHYIWSSKQTGFPLAVYHSVPNANRLWGSSETFPKTPNPSTVSRSGKMVLFKMSATSHQKVSYSKVRPSYPVRPLRGMASSRGGSWVCRYSRNTEPHVNAHYRHPQFLKLKSIPDTIFGLSFLVVAELVRCWPFLFITVWLD